MEREGRVICCPDIHGAGLGGGGEIRSGSKCINSFTVFLKLSSSWITDFEHYLFTSG